MWLTRGIQSALFYYLASIPCLEAKAQSKRRREAAKTRKERATIVTEQPDIIFQPTPFETNQYWAEEIDAGPGPPKGWRGHEAIKKQIRKAEKAQHERNPAEPRENLFPLSSNTTTSYIPPASIKPTSLVAGKSANPTAKLPSYVKKTQSSKIAAKSTIPKAITPSSPKNTQSSTASATSTIPKAKLPSFVKKTQVDGTSTNNSSMSSAAYYNIKYTIAEVESSQWNWARYERPDEPLWGVSDGIISDGFSDGTSDSISKAWSRTSRGWPSDHQSTPYIRPSRRVTLSTLSGAASRESEESWDPDWHPFWDSNVHIPSASAPPLRRKPAIQDLQPNITSIPKERAEYAWMLQPPPSADVMAGRAPITTHQRLQPRNSASTSQIPKDLKQGPSPIILIKQHDVLTLSTSS